MYEYQNHDESFDKLRDIAEKVISLRGISSISEINPELSKNLDLLLHELAESQTELLKQNQRLKDGRDRYFELYDNAPAGYLTLSPNGVITEANLTIAHLLDFSKDDLLQNPFARFIVYEDRAIFYTKFAKLQNGLSSINCNLRLFARNAALVPVEIFCRQIKSALGKVKEHKMALVERHEADDIMTELHPEELELYKSMFWKNTSIGILIDAADGAILYANPSACRFYGYKPESFQRMSIRDIDHSLDEKQMHEYIHRTFAMKKEILNSSHRIMTGENKNVEIHSTPLMMENKKMIFCIIHDVTEQKEFENQLFDYIGSLRRLNDDLSRYALNLAKNVQAPLFAVHRYTNAMIKKLKAAIVNKVPAIKQDL